MNQFIDFSIFINMRIDHESIYQSPREIFKYKNFTISKCSDNSNFLLKSVRVMALEALKAALRLEV